MALHMIGREVQALVIEGLRLLDQAVVFVGHAHLVIGRGKVVVDIGIRRVRLLGILELLKRFGVAALLEKLYPRDTLPVARPATSCEGSEEGDREQNEPQGATMMLDPIVHA